MKAVAVGTHLPTVDLLQPAILSAHELAGLREAQALFGELRSVLFEAIMPAIGGSRHHMSTRIYDLCNEITLNSRNFMSGHWRDAESIANAKLINGREVTHVSK